MESVVYQQRVVIVVPFERVRRFLSPFFCFWFFSSSKLNQLSFDMFVKLYSLLLHPHQSRSGVESQQGLATIDIWNNRTHYVTQSWWVTGSCSKRRPQKSWLQVSCHWKSFVAAPTIAQWEMLHFLLAASNLMCTQLKSFSVTTCSSWCGLYQCRIMTMTQSEKKPCLPPEMQHT